MPTHVESPARTEFEGTLGAAWPLWNETISTAEESCAPLTQVWKRSKTPFGRMCLLQYRNRTLLYLTPDTGRILISIVLGERGFQRALASALPEGIKQLFLEAKPYAEGRGIRFPICSQGDLSTIAMLLEIKIAP